MLEWVFGCIVSTAEKARDAAQRCLNLDPPSGAERAWGCLRAALVQQKRWVDLQMASSELDSGVRMAWERLLESKQQLGDDISAIAAAWELDSADQAKGMGLRSHPIPIVEEDRTREAPSVDVKLDPLRQAQGPAGASSLGWLPPRPLRGAGPSKSSNGHLDAASPSPSPVMPPVSPQLQKGSLHRPPPGWHGDRHMLCVLDYEVAAARAEAHLLECLVSIEEQSIKQLDMKIGMV